MAGKDESQLPTPFNAALFSPPQSTTAGQLDRDEKRNDRQGSSLGRLPHSFINVPSPFSPVEDPRQMQPPFPLSPFSALFVCFSFLSCCSFFRRNHPRRLHMWVGG
ncbi:hypothetical protein PRIPAC_89923 [Pristionchus pacificus]|uniref:Uncharacterized protein n=1 Tax=Pristionchus pacificus TaxID=54126 RepID=A0A2A6CZK1_PRIPA|nr:hypothetical protein PRIPAC_89923 [Pristionchus pacificus]|eukprot:PDM83461.1 hypothetical protein PRIPAC_35093 [Pristionchus pacificus]